MGLLLKCSIYLFFMPFSLAEWNTKDYLKREHSLHKPYQGKSRPSL